MRRLCIVGLLGIVGAGGGCAAGSAGAGSGAGGDGGGATGSGKSSAGPGTGTATSASTGGGPGGGGSTATGTGGASGLPLGSYCQSDAQCASGICKDVLLGVDPVCVSQCTSQQDCEGQPDLFCDPISVGSISGYCVPHSPSHCLSCDTDADCGLLTEVCFKAPGDQDKACHVDCSIGGESACPPEYACTGQTVNGQARKVCRPTATMVCNQSVGGFCDRLVTAQPCSRTTAEGTCTGQRICVTSTKRFDVCSAGTPNCLPDCSSTAPTGCKLEYCTGVLDTAANCGQCGIACPGYMKPNVTPYCLSGLCTFTCNGEHYDVDDNAATGCEVADSPVGNHTAATATQLGPLAGVDCNDGTGVTFSTTGRIVSDKWTHDNPPIAGYDMGTGSAPDFFVIKAIGGASCTNDLSITLQMTASLYPTCYKFTVTAPGIGIYSSSFTDAMGRATLTKPAGAYTSGSNLVISVLKTCGTSKIENVAYTLYGHL